MPRTMTSRAFNQDTGTAKRAAEEGPLFVTDRGRTSHVLLSIGDYERLVRTGPNIVDLIGMTDGGDVEFDPEPMRGPWSKEVDLS